MNISFEGTIISNTLPTCPNQAAGAPIKRGRKGSNNSNKRFRRDRNAMTNNTIPMVDDSSSAALDDLAESLRECSQRLDSSFLDFSTSNRHYDNSTSFNSLNNSMASLGASSFRDFGNTSISNNTAPLPPSGVASSRGPPPLVNFTRVIRESPDRL